MNVLWNEVSEDRFWDMLGAVPPVCHTGDGFLLGEAHSSAICQVNGFEATTYLAFRQNGDKFYEANRALTIAEHQKAVVAPL